MENDFIKVNNYLWTGNTQFINKRNISYYHRKDTIDGNKCLLVHTYAGLFSHCDGLPRVFTICEKENYDLFHKMDTTEKQKDNQSNK